MLRSAETMAASAELGLRQEIALQRVETALRQALPLFPTYTEEQAGDLMQGLRHEATSGHLRSQAELYSRAHDQLFPQHPLLAFFVAAACARSARAKGLGAEDWAISNDSSSEDDEDASNPLVR